jgi:predicted N-acyltransferase
MINCIFNCKSNHNYSFEFSNSISNIDADTWNQLNIKNNIYLSTQYLKALETGMANEMQFRYLTFYNDLKEAVGIAVFQIVSFQAKYLLQERIPCSIADKIQSYFLNDKDLSLLICGNLYACGENGSSYTEKISKDVFFEILTEAIAEIKNTKTNGNKISFSLIKEYWLDSVERIESMEKASFLDFNVDVNMILKMRPEWVNFDLYLGDMNTKYRTRAKGVLKKSKNIKHKSLSSIEIESQLSIIDGLYKQVLSKADYNLGVLKPITFLELKKELGSDFIFTGYFLEEEMIGFSSCFLYNDILDANFVGINYLHNNQYKLYQRMLYDFVKLAIANNKNEVRFGRTAETSKSGVGALPVEMKLFAKHRNLLPSKILKPLISSIKPREFELRKPFKN